MDVASENTINISFFQKLECFSRYVLDPDATEEDRLKATERGAMKSLLSVNDLLSLSDEVKTAFDKGEYSISIVLQHLPEGSFDTNIKVGAVITKDDLEKATEVLNKSGK